MDDCLIRAGLNVRPSITTNRRQLFPKYNCLPFLFCEKLKIRLCKLGSAFALLNQPLQSPNNACDAQWPCTWLRSCLIATLDRFQGPYSDMVHHSINLDRHSQYSWEHLDLLNPVIACTGFSKFSKSSKIHYGISTTKLFCPKKLKNISFDFNFFFTQPGPDCHNAISRKDWLSTLHGDCPEAQITFIFLLNSVNPVHRIYWIQ